MTGIPENLERVDWSSTTWVGARREQMRRWAALPLDRIVASLEEMETLAGSDPASGQESDSPRPTPDAGSSRSP